MTFDLLIFVVLAPLVAGIVLSAAEHIGRVPSLAIAVAVGATIAVIYVMHEGVPPLPPVSSKQKLGLVLLVAPVALLCAHRLKPMGQAIVFALLATACFIWLIQRPLMAGRFSLQWLLPILTIAVFAILPTVPTTRNTSRFAWPVTLIAMSIAACALALLGGFLGLGQVLISLSAFVGGYVLALFLVTLRKGDTTRSSDLSLTAIRFGLGLMLVQLSTFATNLSLTGYLLLLALMALPFADRSLSRLPQLAQPFAYGAAGLLVGGPAILMAVWNL